MYDVLLVFYKNCHYMETWTRFVIKSFTRSEARVNQLSGVLTIQLEFPQTLNVTN